MKTLLLLSLLTAATHGEILHQSANMGTRGSGPSVSFGDQGNAQFISAMRFEVLPGAAAKVTSVGGHMSGGNQSTEIFWTLIARIPVGRDWPSNTGDENPFETSHVIAANAFGAPQNQSREVDIPLAANLPPGTYVVAFGAGGFMDDFLLGPGAFIQPSAANVTDGASAGFFLQFPRDGSENDSVLRWDTFSKNWIVDSSNNNIRMYVEGELIDSPPPIDLGVALPTGTATSSVTVEETEHFGVQFSRQSGGTTDANNVYTSEDYVYTVEVSDDVETWTPAGLEIAFSPPVDQGDGTETTTAYFVQEVTASPQAKFMRILVSRNSAE